MKMLVYNLCWDNNLRVQNWDQMLVVAVVEIELVVDKKVALDQRIVVENIDYYVVDIVADVVVEAIIGTLGYYYCR
jgi:hypothetical protein